MADPTLVLLIVIGTSPVDRLHGGIVSGAIVEALGRDARVLVEERASDPPDAEAAGVVDRMRGSAVAEIAWVDAAHTHARVHVFLASDRTWYDRELAFDAGDSADERERSVGFLVGAMIRTTEDVALPPAPPAPSPAAAEPSRPAPVAAKDVAAPPPSPRRWARFAVDVAAVVTGGIGGDAASLGPAVRGHVVIFAPLSVHAGASLGFGSIDAADARSITTRIVVGGRWTWLTVARDVSFDVGLDALAVNHVVRRADPAADRDRWLTGGHADLGVGWRVTAGVEPFVNGGLDAVAGDTPITVAGRALAHLPPLRAVAEAGMRVRF